MPGKLKLTGKPEDLVNLQVLIPLALKQRVAELARARGKTLSDYIRDVIVEDLERRAAIPATAGAAPKKRGTKASKRKDTGR